MPGVPFRRYVRPDGADHMYAVTDAQVGAAVARGYVFERNMGYVLPDPVDGTLPLYQLFSERAPDHLCTVSEQERADSVSDNGYVDLGVLGHVYTRANPFGGMQELYRLFHPASCRHLYSDRYAEVVAAQSQGYEIEQWGPDVCVYVMQNRELPAVTLWMRVREWWRRHVTIRSPKLLVAGIVLILAAVIGGGVELASVSVPVLDRLWVKIVVGAFGAVLIVLSMTVRVDD